MVRKRVKSGDVVRVTSGEYAGREGVVASVFSNGEGWWLLILDDPACSVGGNVEWVKRTDFDVLTEAESETYKLRKVDQAARLLVNDICSGRGVILIPPPEILAHAAALIASEGCAGVQA